MPDHHHQNDLIILTLMFGQIAVHTNHHSDPDDQNYYHSDPDDRNDHSDPDDKIAGDGGDGQALLADFPSNGSGMLPR